MGWSGLYNADAGDHTKPGRCKGTKKDGKGNVYAEIIRHHVSLLDAIKTASKKAFATAFCS